MAAVSTGSAGWLKSPAGKVWIAISAINILGPLGMHDTGYRALGAQRARQASLHVRKSDGTLVAAAVGEAG